MATIYFDLDGTVYDLYNVPNWLERITTMQDASAYAEGRLMYAKEELGKVLDALVAAGHKVGVISWLAGGEPTAEFNKNVRRIKRAWIKENMPQVTEVHVVKYGTPKHHVCKDKTNAILVDDNADVRNVWTRGQTINAKDDIIPALLQLAG